MTVLEHLAAYRLTLYAPRSEQTTPGTETDLLYPRAGALHADPFQVWTLPTTAPWKGYLLPPRGRRSSVDLRDRKSDTGSLTLEVLDKRLGTTNDERWFAQFLTSTGGEGRLGHCLAYVEESLDRGATWTSFFTGRVRTIRQTSRLTWELVVRDLVEDWKREIFVGPPESSVSGYATVSPLLPHHNVAAYQNVPARAWAPAKIRVSGGGADPRLELNTGAPYDRWCIVSKALGSRAKSLQSLDIGSYTLTVLVYELGPVRAKVRNPATSAEGTFHVNVIRCRNDKVHAIAQHVTLAELDPGDAGYATWASLGAVGADIEVMLYATGPLGGQHAVMISNVHPVQLLADLADGAFGLLQADGTPHFTIRRDAVAGPWTAMIADPSWGLVSFIIQKEARFTDWVQEYLCKPFGLVITADADGYLVPVDVRPGAAAGLDTITDDDVVADESGEEWAQDTGAAINFVRVSYWADLPQTDFAPSRDTASYPDSHPGLIQSIPIEKGQPGTAANIIDLSLRPFTVKADGIRYAPDYVSFGGAANAERAANQARRLAFEWLDEYARGPRTITLTCRRTAVPSAVQPGDRVLIDVTTILNPDTLTYGGTTLARCVGREEAGPTLILRFQLAGVTAVADVPTIGTPTLGAATTQGAVVDAAVTLNADSEPAEVMFAATATSVAVRPADTDAAWTGWTSLFASGTASYGPLQTGVRVWVRARTRPALQSTGFKQPSAWVYPAGTGYVDTASLSAPTSVATANITGTTVDVTWAGGTDGDLVQLLVHAGSDTVNWVDGDVVATFPAPPRFFQFTGLTPSTVYSVGVRFLDPQGGVSAVSGVSFTTAGVATTAPRLGGIAFAYYSAIEFQVYPGDRRYDIEVERAPDLAGAPDTANAVAFYIPNDGHYRDPLPADYATYWYRARHRLVAAGVTDGPWLTWVAAVARPNVPDGTTPPPYDVVVPAPIQPVLPSVVVAQSSSGGTGTLTLTITDPQQRLALVEFQTYDAATAITSAWTADAAPPYSTTVPYSGAGVSIIRYRISGTDANGVVDQVLAQGEVYFSDVLPAHASTHENGGSDEIDVTGLSGLLADAQPVAIRKNSTGAAVGTRRQINLIEGSNVTITVNDDPVTDEVDVTIAASSSGSAPYISAPDYITDSLNDAFWRDAALDTGGTRFAGAGAWAWVNQGAATATIVRKRLELVAPASATSSKRLVVQTLPSGNWRYRCDVAIGGSMSSSTEAGLVLRESATGKLMTLQIGFSGSFLVWCAEWNSPTSFNNTRNTQAMTSQFLLPTRLEFEYDGTSYIARYSMADVGYYTLTTRAKTGFFTTGADQVGVFVNSENSQIITGLFREFYRVV